MAGPTVSPVRHERHARWIRRLREELVDAAVPLVLDGDHGAAMLEELDYARHPPTHEGVLPYFGALVVPTDALDPRDLGFPALFETTVADPDVVRTLADGRTSFIARGPSGAAALVSFDRTIEHEATAVQVATSAGITVIQRQFSGWVRIFAPNAVVVWDGARWWSKPLARDLAAAVRAARPELTSPVLDGLTELCVHWLSASRIGALLVWQADAAAPPLGHLGTASSVAIPTLHMMQRQHYAAMRNALAQQDRAALVAPDGRMDRVGVALRWSEDAVADVESYRGTRHTAARRFTYDERAAVVIAVSSAGPVSVMHGGEIISVNATTPGAEVG